MPMMRRWRSITIVMMPRRRRWRFSVSGRSVPIIIGWRRWRRIITMMPVSIVMMPVIISTESTVSYLCPAAHFLNFYALLVQILNARRFRSDLPAEQQKPRCRRYYQKFFHDYHFLSFLHAKILLSSVQIVNRLTEF